MKKSIFFVLGALLVALMPGNGLEAQNIQVDVSVTSLDRAALSSARIYAATPGQAYYIDAAHLDLTWSGSAVNISSVSTYTDLSILSDGFTVSGIVDSSTYNSAFIVVSDTNDRYYVFGMASRDQLDTGIFYPVSFVNSAVSGVCNVSVIPTTHMLGRDRIPILTASSNYFTTLEKAFSISGDGEIFIFRDTVEISNPLTLTNNATVYQQGYPVRSTYIGTSPLITVSDNTLSWYGSSDPTIVDFDIQGGLGNIFAADSAVLNLRQLNATAINSVVTASRSSNITVASSTLGSTLDAPVIILYDASNATVSTVAATSATFVRMDDAATGILTILDSTAAATSASIVADAYFKDANYRKYGRTLTRTVAVASDTVFLACNTPAGINDFIDRPAVINLGGNTFGGTLVLNTSSDTVFLMNGNIETLSGSPLATGTVSLSDLDSVNSFAVYGINAEILSGRYVSVSNINDGQLSIKGGKYGQDISAYLAPRHVMLPNTDADAVTFPYTVASGYRVTFVNYNARRGQPGYQDSVAIINTVDNRITPVPTRPAYVGTDTVLAAYWIDSNFTTPWNFLNDVLVSDTVLYAQWYTYNVATDIRCQVLHWKQSITGVYSCVDTILCIAPMNTTVSFVPLQYIGYHSVDSAFSATVTADTVVNFYYDRNIYQLTWDLNGGVSSDPGFATVQTLFFGQTITYPTSVTRPGHTHVSWTPLLSTMPAGNVTIRATYSANSYPVTWNALDTTVVYNGTVADVLSATYVDDESNVISALLTYTDPVGDETQPINAGVYNVVASSADTNYHLTGTLQTTLTITPATVTAVGILVDSVKLYDGNPSTNVINQGTPSTVYGSDDLSVYSTAYFDDANVGTGKTITAFPILMGTSSSNYTLLSSSQVVTNNGAILAPIAYETDSADNGIATASGYCAGDAAGVRFFLESGTVDEYKLDYGTDAIVQGFVDVDWTPITTAGQIDLVIPTNALDGTYTATLTLRNSAYPSFVSSPVNVTFKVNLSKNYVMPIFVDVISIVDTCHCIDQSSVKWFHNGSYVADGPYYQEPGGVLTGTYHATFTMNGVARVTCEQDDVNTLISQEPVSTKLTAYPNPTIDRVTLHLDNAVASTHTLRVMSVLGVTIVDTTFEGDTIDVDLSSFLNGSYTVSVDGMVVRVIKK